MKQWYGAAGDSVRVYGEAKAFAVKMTLPATIEKLTRPYSGWAANSRR
jgi:hypothetical protein